MSPVDKRARRGMETDPDRMDQTDRVAFFHNVRELKKINVERDDQRARSMVIDHLHGYIGMERFGRISPEEVDAEYEHYQECISAAQHEIEGYFKEMVVDDIAQRLSLVDELTGVSDPLTMTDMMLTADDQATRFEVRRALHAGAMYFEYDKRIGREDELHSIIHGVEMYIAAFMFTTGNRRDVELYHKVKESEGGEQLSPSSIRIPAFDHSDVEREPGENKVRLSFREFPNPNNPQEVSHVIMQRRLKDRFSAMLKAIRKGVSIGSLQDVIGMAMYVDHHDTELQTVVKRLEELFDVDEKDRRVHPIRTLAGSRTSRVSTNRHSSNQFTIEQLNITLHAKKLAEQRPVIDQVLQRFFSSQRSIDAFWKNLEQYGARQVPMEIQVGTLANMLRNNLAGGDENHRIYKVNQVSGGMQGDSRGALELLAPQKLYGIDWESDEIRDVLLAKQRAQLGLNRQVLNRAVE